MAKINLKLSKPKTQDGTEIELTPNRSGGGGSYALVVPDYYTAILHDLQTLSDKESKYQTKIGQMLKLRPHIELVNDNKTVINRQDYTVGQYDDEKGLYTDKPGNSPVWGHIQGARGLLTALDMFKELEDGTYVLDFDTDNISNRVLRVRVGVAAYIKGDYKLTDTVRYPENFDAVMTSLNGGVDWELEDLEHLIPAFDSLYPSEFGIKTKNMITGFYAVKEWEAEENGWYSDGDQVFLTEKDYDQFHANRLDSLDSDEMAW